MLMHIVTQLSGRFMALYTQALEWLKVQLWHRAKHLLASFIRVSQSVVNLCSQLVQTVLNINRFRVNLITAVQLIKAALINAQVKVLQIGSRLVTTVRQISQRVATMLLQKKDKLVECIKLVLSRLKGNKIAQILMVRLLIQGGLKLREAVKRLLQRVKAQFKKDK